MSETVWFVTHPAVVIDPAMPVTEWPLTEAGRNRMRAALALPWTKGLAAIWCSTERKAIDAAEILAAGTGLDFSTLAALGVIALLIIGAAGYGMSRVATGFIPIEDQGYLLAAVQLPDGASLERTHGTLQQVTKIARATREWTRS